MCDFPTISKQIENMDFLNVINHRFMSSCASWKMVILARQIRPGKPVQLPRLLDSALRLTSVIIDGGMDGGKAVIVWKEDESRVPF